MNIKQLAVILVILGGLWYAYNAYEDKQYEPYRKESARIREAMAEQNRQVFNNAQVTIHGAYPYAGESNIQVDAKGKLVAVDVSLKGVQPGVDLDDIDIIDAEGDRNLGSDPDRVNLEVETGKIMADPKQRKPENMRLLLLYAVPRELKGFKLGYWGRDLTTQTTTLLESAPAEAPKPEKKQVFGNHRYGNVVAF